MHQRGRGVRDGAMAAMIGGQLMGAMCNRLASRLRRERGF